MQDHMQPTQMMNFFYSKQSHGFVLFRKFTKTTTTTGSSIILGISLPGSWDERALDHEGWSGGWVGECDHKS